MTFTARAAETFEVFFKNELQPLWLGGSVIFNYVILILYWVGFFQFESFACFSIRLNRVCSLWMETRRMKSAEKKTIRFYFCEFLWILSLFISELDAQSDYFNKTVANALHVYHVNNIYIFLLKSWNWIQFVHNNIPTLSP